MKLIRLAVLFLIMGNSNIMCAEKYNMEDALKNWPTAFKEMMDEELQEELARQEELERIVKTVEAYDAAEDIATTKEVLYQAPVSSITIAMKTIVNARGQNGTPAYSNQDRAYVSIVKPATPDHNEIIITGICDGHGAEGDTIAQFTRDQILKLLQEKLQKYNTLQEVVDSQVLTTLGTEIQESIKNEYPNALDSGTTVCFSLVQKNPDLKTYSIVTLNMGDSRAIVIQSEKDSLINSTTDHKASDPQEIERIKEAGGYTFVHTNNVTYATHNDAAIPIPYTRRLRRPNIATSRGVGDIALYNKGVLSSIPEIKFLPQQNDGYIVVASDGVWDVIENKDVASFVQTAPEKGLSLQEICSDLAKKARKARSSDDITIIVVKL